MNLSIIKKLACILNKKQQRKIFGLGILILIGGLLETLGVSMMLPLVTAIMDVERMQQNKYVQMICGWFHIENMNHFCDLFAHCGSSGICAEKCLSALFGICTGQICKQQPA